MIQALSFARLIAATVSVAALSTTERARSADAESRSVVLALQPIPGPRPAATTGATKSQPIPPPVIFALPTPRAVLPQSLKLRAMRIRISTACSIDPVTKQWICVRTVEGIEPVDDKNPVEVER